MSIGVFASYKTLVWIERCVDVIVPMHNFGIYCIPNNQFCYISVMAKLVETFPSSNPFHSARRRNEYLHLLPSCDNLSCQCTSFGDNEQRKLEVAITFSQKFRGSVVLKWLGFRVSSVHISTRL